MSYRETRYARTQAEAQKAKADLDREFGGFPCQGQTTIRPTELIDAKGAKFPGFEVTCIHYGTN